MPARRRRKQKQKQQEKERVFHLFGKLPTELRLEIWTHTWEPRTVTIYPTENGVFMRPRGGNFLPASGYVNFESRSETLRYYKRCFDHGDEKDFRWFNFDLDTLCVATDPCLDLLDLTELRQLQRLIVPDDFPGVVRAATRCRDTWPKPITESFESAKVEEYLQEYYPSLREVTLTTSKWGWYMVPPKWEYRFLFRPSESSFKGWGHMRTTYVGRLRIRHSPAGSKTDRQRYSRRFSKKDVDWFLELIADLLLYCGPDPDDSSEAES
ncbi:hypothetical protein O1611_g7112 [Lasiodiplodia mahajangana]|uniref:Uncharacterized protein n=1 Tax=Lasiodiplodia mahajangana TaxID=1108764 RepID=A0ACC2JGN4_9PEZI|nr:hypothetical protein O1611_g7112 [Lasiodiplodia mahajangana]